MFLFDEANKVSKANFFKVFFVYTMDTCNETYRFKNQIKAKALTVMQLF